MKCWSLASHLVMLNDVTIVIYNLKKNNLKVSFFLSLKIKYNWFLCFYDTILFSHYEYLAFKILMHIREITVQEKISYVIGMASSVGSFLISLLEFLITWDTCGRDSRVSWVS